MRLPAGQSACSSRSGSYSTVFGILAQGVRDFFQQGERALQAAPEVALICRVNSAEFR